MDVSKKSRDYFPIFYIINWFLGLALIPLSRYLGIFMLMSFIQLMSSGESGFLQGLMVLGLVLGLLVLVYLAFYLIFAIRSLIQSFRAGRESLYLAPISLIFLLLIQCADFLLALTSRDLQSSYRLLFGFAQTLTLVPFIGYLYGRHGFKGQKNRMLLWTGHILNGILFLVLAFSVVQSQLPQLSKVSQIVSRLERGYKDLGMDAKLEFEKDEYQDMGSADPDFEQLYPTGKLKVTLGKHTFYEKIKVSQQGKIEEVAFLDAKRTPTPILRILLKESSGEDNLIRVKERTSESLKQAGIYVTDSPVSGRAEVSTSYLANPKHTKARTFKERGFELEKIWQLDYHELLAKEDVLTLVRIEFEQAKLLSNQDFIKSLDFSRYPSGTYIFEIKETDKNGVSSEEQFEVQVKDGKLDLLTKTEKDQDLTKDAAPLLDYESGGSVGYSVRDGFDYLVDWPYE